MLEAGGIQYAFKITHPGLEGKIANLSIGEAAAARIVAQYLMLAGERVEPRPPRQTAPLMLKMREPGRGHY